MLLKLFQFNCFPHDIKCFDFHLQNLKLKMDTNVYNLIWQSYPDHLREMMQNMMQADNFTDVTIVTDDKKLIKAHRNILSACSPVLNDILLKMDFQTNHPFIYLRGIQSSEMESILQFIYQGEAKFAEYRLNEFLSASQSLEIKQLSKNAESEKKQLGTPLADQCEYMINETYLKRKDFTEDTEENNDKNEDLADDTGEENEKYQQLTENNKEERNDENQDLTEDTEISTLNTSPSMKGDQLERQYKCDKCEKQFINKYRLNFHIKNTHSNVKFACNYCHKQFNQKVSMKIHVESVHKGVKFGCNQDQCESLFSTKGALRKHIQSIHKAVSLRLHHK